MKTIICNYQNEDDSVHIRRFLQEVSLLNDRHEYSWSLLRWDYWVWHVNMNIFHLDLKEVVHLWMADGKLVAMLNPDTPGEAFFQVHPMHHTEALLGEMLDMAETKLPSIKENGRCELITWVNEKDALHKDLLTRRGYIRSRYKAEHMRRRFLTQPIPESVSPGGYTVRALGDESELPARSWLSWKAFHPEEPD